LPDPRAPVLLLALLAAAALMELASMVRAAHAPTGLAGYL